MLRRLKAKGARCCIVSSKTRSRINQTIEKEHLESLVDCVVGMEDVSEAKPSPEGFSRFSGALISCRLDILYVGDSLIDAETASMQA